MDLLIGTVWRIANDLFFNIDKIDKYVIMALKLTSKNTQLYM